MERDQYSVISLLFGVLSAVFYWLIPILPPLAIVSGCIALSKIKKNGLKGKKMAVAGIVLGSLYCFQIILKLCLYSAL